MGLPVLGHCLCVQTHGQRGVPGSQCHEQPSAEHGISSVLSGFKHAEAGCMTWSQARPVIVSWDWTRMCVPHRWVQSLTKTMEDKAKAFYAPSPDHHCPVTLTFRHTDGHHLSSSCRPSELSQTQR